MNRRTRTAGAPARIAALLLIMVAMAAVAGCAIQPDAAPRDIPEEDRGAFGANQGTGDEAAGTSLIFLLAPNDPGEAQLLRSVKREGSGSVNAIVRSLFAGPNPSELDAGIETAIPPELTVNSIRTSGQVSTVDVSDALDELDAVSLRYAVAQIVTTVTALDEADAVLIRVDGEDRLWPRGDGELTSRPLTPYDYPGLVESTQPDYPAVPSPVA